MSYLGIDDLNPDDHLSIAIAATFAVSAFHVYDKPVLRKKIFMLLEWKSYSKSELTANHDLVWYCASYSSAQSSSNTLRATHSSYSTAYAFSAALAGSSVADSSSSVHAYYAANNSRSALRIPDSEDKYIHGVLIHLLPLILDYKINQSKVSFEDSEKVLELLGEDCMEKFIFNLDILQ